MTKIQNPTETSQYEALWSIGISNFEFVSCFGFRISDFRKVPAFL